jgi:DNA-binding response OmpR family regulator
MAITRSQRILVVDDEPVFCGAICRALALDYHCVEFVASGKSALAVLEDNDFDLLITDNGLPGMSGHRLVAAAKALRPNLLIALIAANAKSLKPIPFAGVDYINGKPFEMEELRHAVTRLLRSRRALTLVE